MDKLIPFEMIERKIYLLRGQRVMLDRDLAELYGVTPRRLREQVKRNSRRFPSDFMFRLTEKELDFMVSQNATPSRKYFGGHFPYAFTEHGALMLSSVLSSEKAVKVGIFVVRAFIRMREIISSHKRLLKKIEEMEKKYDAQFKIVFDALRRVISPTVKSKNKIGFLRGGES